MFVAEGKFNRQEKKSKFEVLIWSFQRCKNLVRKLNEKEQRIAELNQKIQQLQQELQTDPLTQVYNRRFLEGKKDSYCIVIDVDDFKNVNDTHGHETGDKALIGIAQALKNEVREGDVVRYGGDEFLILLRNMKNIQEVKTIVNRLNYKIPYVEVSNDQGKTVKVGISVGFDKNFKAADTAMYLTKKKRKETTEKIQRQAIYQQVQQPALAKVQ